MSPLWRDQIRVVLYPTQVVLLRLGAGWRGRITAQQIIPCHAAAPGEASWRNALTALQTPLDEMDKADVFVVLSNHFVRYALIPHSNDMVSDEEQDALVRHSYARLYGEGAERWLYRLNHHADRDGNRFSCAIDRELAETLNAVMQAKGMCLRSIQPFFTVALNQWRHRLRDNAWFVVVERGRLCLAEWCNKRWHAVKSINIDDDWVRELADELHRDSFLATSDNTPETKAPVFIFSTVSAAPKLSAIAGHAIELLSPARRRGDTEADTVHYAMSLVG